MPVQSATNNQNIQDFHSIQNMENPQKSQYSKGIIMGTVATGALVACAFAINSLILSKTPTQPLPSSNSIRFFEFVKEISGINQLMINVNTLGLDGIAGMAGGLAGGSIGAYYSSFYIFRADFWDIRQCPNFTMRGLQGLAFTCLTTIAGCAAAIGVVKSEIIATSR